jgi:hypothetical protein
MTWLCSKYCALLNVQGADQAAEDPETLQKTQITTQTPKAPHRQGVQPPDQIGQKKLAHPETEPRQSPRQVEQGRTPHVTIVLG